MYYAELNVPKNHVYLFKPQPNGADMRMQVWSGLVQGENGIIFNLNMSGEMHMRRRNEVFGCIPHGRGAFL